MGGSPRTLGLLASALLVALGSSAACTDESDDDCLAVRVEPNPKDVYADYAIFMIDVDSCGSCNPTGYSLRWWNEANGAAGTGEVVDMSGCFPGFGCSCWLEGQIGLRDPPLAMGANLVWIEVTDPKGRVARDSILITRHPPYCPCFTAEDVAARIAQVPTMRVRETTFVAGYSDPSCQGASLSDEPNSSAWGYSALTMDPGSWCKDSSGEIWYSTEVCANADGEFVTGRSFAQVCIEILRSFAAP